MYGKTNECTHVGTAAAINDHKTAHKHNSFAPFQAYDNTEKCSASGGLTPRPGALPLDHAGPIWPPQSLLLDPYMYSIQTSY